MSEKTHWKQGMDSPYMGAWDLPEMKPIQLNIKYVKKHLSKGLKDDATFNFIYWKEKGWKPMLLNSTNNKVMRAITGTPYIEEWHDIPVELYVERDIKAFGTLSDGLRIRNKKIDVKKVVMNEQHPKWDEVQLKLKNKAVTLETIKKHYDYIPNKKG